jgi:hypothetical protein
MAGLVFLSWFSGRRRAFAKGTSWVGFSYNPPPQTGCFPHGGLWLAAVSSEHRTWWLFLISDVGSSRTTDTKLSWFTSSNAPSNVIGDQDDQSAQLVIAIIIIILY